MPKQIDDDEVLQLMTKLGLDSENEFTFRATRHYFRHGVPPCCISFNVHLWDNLCNYLPHDHRKIERLVAKHRNAGMLCISRDDYFFWVATTLGNMHAGRVPQWANGYTPCPRCVLDKSFVQIPNTCRCCADKAHDDDAGAPPPPAEPCS